MRVIIIGLVLIAALAVLRLTVFSGNEASDAGKNGPKKMAMPVTGYIVSASTFSESIYATGTLHADEMVNLSPEIAGKVISIQFKEGQKVSKGQLLIKLNDAELQANLRKAQAQLKLNQDKLKRLDDLIKIQGVSIEERDQTAQVVEASQSDIAFIRAQIDKTEIKAPFNGVTGLRSISEGAFVTAGQSISSIYQTESLKLDFSIPEQYISKLKIPFEVEFGVDGSENIYKAQVYAMNPGLNSTTRSIELRAKVANNSGELIAGRFAKVTMQLLENSNALLVPTEAIVPVLKGQQIWLSRKGEAQKVDVTLGYRSDAMIEVSSGLSAGDTVLTTGIMNLKPGTPLKIISVRSSNVTAK